MAGIVIIGATSAIAQEVAKLLATRKDSLFLVARNPSKLEAIKKDLEARGANVKGVYETDLNDINQHVNLLNLAQSGLGEIDTVLIAHGTLGDQHAGEKDFKVALSVINDNFISTASLLTVFSNYFEKRKAGCLAVITSVAGDRGRKKNYIYGSAKGALNVFLQGLRNRLEGSGVSVITIKPGFVDTPMTLNFKKSFLFAKPETIAKGILTAIQKKKDSVYLPWFWKPIMWLIGLIPECIFKKLNI